eukprot:Nitzschia sp. Nitz4//scaffold8_size234185//133089//136932//NITZ4_001270-RA/size234185-augustus-gene-0.271-mRNA-1//-1//CDS//3329559845//654//frame0
MKSMEEQSEPAPLESIPLDDLPTNSNNNMHKSPTLSSRKNPTPCKLRRKVTVDDALDRIASIQRLVEYFVVVSCLPRWDANVPNSELKAPRSPRAHSKHSVPSNVHDKADANIPEPPVNDPPDDTLPPPKPRGTWKREDNADAGNIHMPPQTSDEYTFQPKITSRYPPTDYPGSPLNPMITQFCYPVTDVVVPTTEYQMPQVHHFVLTNDKGRKLYGTCLTVMEEYKPPNDAPLMTPNCIHTDPEKEDIEVTMGKEQTTLFLPRCLCILSIWPYMDAFREYLAQLYRLATSTNCMTAPIERYILNLCMEIPAPPPGAFEVQLNILDSVIRFWSPPAKLPIAYVALPYQVLFDCLDIDNILHLWYCLTLERKVLLVSSQYSLLTVCAEILCSLLYPMKWSHLYVPLLPRFLSPMLEAPVPYLCGVTRDSWLHVQQFISDETIVVDLDHNSVMFGEQTPALPVLPGKKWMKLRSTLEENAGHLFWRTRGLEKEYRQLLGHKLNQWGFKRAAKEDGEKRWKEKLSTYDQAFNLQFTPDSENMKGDEKLETIHNQWDKVQEAFLRFFVAMMKNYRRYLSIPETTSQNLGEGHRSSDWMHWSSRRSFDVQGFIESEKREYRPFLTELTATQQFDDFITKRLYSPEMPDLIFFDQSIDAKLNRSRLKLKKVDTPFLEGAKIHKVLETVNAVEPNPRGLTIDGPFIYKSWPETFRPELFGSPRPIPSIITAEFDRQAALVSRLRSNQNDGDADDSLLLDFYSSDYNLSAEGMAFTVFFYTYSAVIGKEWEAYRKKQLEMEGFTDNFVEETHISRESDNPAASSNVIDLEQLHSDQILSDLTLGMCDVCPEGSAQFDDAVVYMTTTPCPQRIDELNVNAQIAIDTISKLTNGQFQRFEQQRSTSLLDDDQGLEEYEEAREVASAQLDLAFDILETMEKRGVIGDPDAYKSLMEACGRCGDQNRALELVETMKQDGLVADQEVLSCFVAAFSTHPSQSATLLTQNETLDRQQSDAYTMFLRKRASAFARHATDDTLLSKPSDSEVDSSDAGSSSGSESALNTTSLQASSIFSWMSANGTDKAKRRSRRKRKRKAVLAATKQQPLTSRLLKQILLGDSLLDFLYPNLMIDMQCDSCPQCSHLMSEQDVVAGWQPCDFKELTSRCPVCQHRFVPRFTISTTAPTFVGSQGPNTPLYCEFLSPWVLRKELSHLVDKENGIDSVLNPEWRSGTDIGATLWWNLVAMFKRHDLPFSFLLQGSFQNRLINPLPED